MLMAPLGTWTRIVSNSFQFSSLIVSVTSCVQCIHCIAVLLTFLVCLCMLMMLHRPTPMLSVQHRHTPHGSTACSRWHARDPDGRTQSRGAPLTALQMDRLTWAFHPQQETQEGVTQEVHRSEQGGDWKHIHNTHIIVFSYIQNDLKRYCWSQP